MQKFELNRFKRQQDLTYEKALAEIKNGFKETHWMWWIFPQIKGLGYSYNSELYGLEGIEEAKAYLDDEELRANLIEICEALLEDEAEDAFAIFGTPDDMKLKSSMTIFSLACPECEVFKKVLEKFFGGELDRNTEARAGIFSSGKEWDESEWLKNFKDASKAKDKEWLYSLRVQVLNNTKKICENGSYEKDGKLIEINAPDESTMYSQEIELNYEYSEMYPSRYQSQPVEVFVVNEDCLATARRLVEEGYRPLVLNMANRHTPGGGVEYGAGAQEECLFRSSNYYQTLYPLEDKYPMDWNHGGIYSPKVTVFRGLEEDGYPLLEKPFDCAFAAVAAINNPELDSEGKYTESSKEATKNKIRTILNIAHENKHGVLVLSAFGCGAFRNPPEQMAQLFKEVLEEEIKNESEKGKKYYFSFKKIYFSIKSDHNDSKNINYESFKKILDNCFG